MPADWLTVDDLLYIPWRPVPESQYGQSPLESVLMTANTDLRFQKFFLDYFTESTVPAGFMEAPADMSDPTQLAEFQEAWDALMRGDQEMLRRIRWVPAGAKYTAAKNSTFDEDFPLYLMRRVAAAYGITPADLGYTETVNKSSGDTQADVQWRIGTLPVVRHVEDVVNMFVTKHLGLRCRLQFDKGQEIEDRLMTAQADQILINGGVVSVDEIRAKHGEPIDRSRPMPRFINNPRTGPIPLIAIESMAGKIDEETYAPDQSQPLVSNPYMPTPGTLADLSTPEGKAGMLASAQAGRDMLAASSGGKPSGQMQALIAQSTPAPPGAAPAAAPDADAPAPAAKEAAAGPVAGLGAESGIQGVDLIGQGSDDDDEDDDELAKATDVALELRRWRENARNRLRKGQPPRRFTSSVLDADLTDDIWQQLQGCTTRREVDAVFAESANGPFRYRPRSRIGRP
jgi:hypothetical protein